MGHQSAFAYPGKFGRGEIKADGLGNLTANAILHGADPFYFLVKRTDTNHVQAQSEEGRSQPFQKCRTAAGLLDGPGTGT